MRPLLGSWNDLRGFHEKTFEGTDAASSPSDKCLWVYRGQGSHDWKLESALDRSRTRYKKITDGEWPYIEEGLIREFQRRVRTTGVNTDLPAHENVTEWLGLMRHYGAPTRILDWTYSFYVALFFASENASGNFAVWALNARWCNQASREVLPKNTGKITISDPYVRRIDTFRWLFARSKPLPVVYRINPFVLNSRLAIQKGLFLCPGMITKSFHENLRSLHQMSARKEPVGYKIVINAALREQVIKKLYYMNITRESLLPGLDGLAQALNTRLAVPESLYPSWRQKRGTRAFVGWERD